MLLLETFVEKKFKFVLEMRTAKEKFEKELRCIDENTPSATDQVMYRQPDEEKNLILFFVEVAFSLYMQSHYNVYGI
jgi:hypothetical protein